MVEIYFLVGRTSSETRLVVENGNTTTIAYSHKDYEDLLFHFNTVTRTTYWPHDVKGEGLDHCYDCAAEIRIIYTVQWEACNVCRRIHK